MMLPMHHIQPIKAWDFTYAVTGNQLHQEASLLHIGSMEIYIIQSDCIVQRCINTVTKRNVTTDINLILHTQMFWDTGGRLKAEGVLEVKTI